MRKSFVLAIVFWGSFFLVVSPSPRIAQAQTLDDAIDAELDDVSAGNMPSTEAKTAPPAKPAASVDDVQLDDDSAAAPKQASEKPPAPPVSETGAGPSPGLVDDELKLDEGDSSKAAEAPKVEDAAPDLELDSQPAKQEAAKPKEESAPSESTPSLEPAPAPAPAVAQEPPPTKAKPGGVQIDSGNATYERRLSQYARGYKQVPDVSWDEIVGDRRQENYRLQRGDTLWDISSTFFGDGFFWAKLWSQNGVIGNPHMILKGKGIRFVAGTESDAPAIGVVDIQQNNEVVATNPFKDSELERPTYREEVQSDITPEEIESGVVLETDELIPAPELPPPQKRVPLLKELPKSFEESHAMADTDYDTSGLKTPTIRAHVPPTVFINSLILDGQPDEVGKVDEIELQDRFAAVGQGVFVRANKELAIGSRLTFVRRRDQAKGVAGPVVDVLGVGVVDGTVKENSNTYHLTVTTALVPVEKGALVLADAPPRVVVSRDGHHSDKHVKIVGGEFEESRRIMGAPAVVFLNGGASNGLRSGDILGVEAKRGSRRETRYADYLHPIAILKVADVRQKVSTAIVVSSTEPIMVGDYTGGDLPEDLPSLRAESAEESATAFGRKEPLDIK